jgi:hypothetical protein
VIITFMASGEDLPHPDENLERIIEQRAGATSAPSEEDDEADEEKTKIQMTVKDEAGNVIRSFSFLVHQGINRIVWPMNHDGIRPMPGPKPRRLEDGLPGGPEIPPGEYEVSLQLDSDEFPPAETSTRVMVLPDPRVTTSPDQQRLIYESRLALLEMMEIAVGAVERIVNTRADIDTVIKLIANRPGAKEDERLKALSTQANELHKSLDDLENRFRKPPETRGITYDEDRIANRIGTAQSYVTGSARIPGQTADVYTEIARRALEQGLDDLDQFMGKDLAAFRTAVDEAGVGLFQTPGTLKAPKL